MRSRLALITCLALGLAGCALSQLSSALRVAGNALSPTGGGLSAGIRPEADPVQVETKGEGGFGTVRISIKWPDRDPARYSAQAMPLAANSVHVKVTLDDGSPLGETLVARQSGTATATASLRVAAGTGLSMRARAYRESQPNLGTAAVLAEGLTSVDVAESLVSTASIKLRINIQGDVSTWGGAPEVIDGVGQAARFVRPRGMVRDPDTGDLYVADLYGVRKVTPDGTVTTLAGGTEYGDADGTGADARFGRRETESGCSYVARDSAGNLYVSEAHKNRVRKITPQGVVTTKIPYVGQPNGVAVDGDGNLYVVSELYKKIFKYDLDGNGSVYAGSGTQAVADGQDVSASFDTPVALVRDSDGTLYVGDANRIRRISPTRYVDTVDAPIDNNYAFGLSLDSGTLYFTYLYELGKIVLSSSARTTLLRTYAREPKTFGYSSAILPVPGEAGAYYFTDEYNGRIRKLSTGGQLSTFAGNGDTDGPIA